MSYDLLIMRPEYPKWPEFKQLLIQHLGSPQANTCNHKMTMARRILRKHFPEIDILKTMDYFEKKGAFCSCEVLLNVR